MDKLSILNVKIYVVQDRVHEAAEKGVGLSAEDTKKLVDLNLARSRTMTELDALLADAVKTGKVIVDPRNKIL